MANENRDSEGRINFPRNSVKHTGAFDGVAGVVDRTSHHARETAYGEDWQTTTNVVDGLLRAGFDLMTVQKIMAPRLIAGIKSEREYRRECHRSLKELGHVAGRHLYNGVIHERDAALMLRDFVDVSAAHGMTKVGLELGHIELLNTHMSPDQAWKKLDDMAEKVVDKAGLEGLDARDVPSSQRGAIFTDETLDGSGEIRLPRARTNFPVLDIGQTGLQQFVRIAVGYDTSDQTPMSLQSLRSAHKYYMENHSDKSGIVRLDEDTIAYPLSATLVTLRR